MRKQEAQHSITPLPLHTLLALQGRQCSTEVHVVGMYVNLTIRFQTL